uniref:amino acid adenylation domain-containing protein n=1 Tax=Aquimonas sp. TaxID=1872588 RepID=UPI0037BEFFBA
MKLVDLIRRCADAQVALSLQDGALKLQFDQRPSEALLDALRANKQAVVDLLARDVKRTTIPPCAERRRARASYAQRRLWFVDRYQQGQSHQYNMPGAFRLSGEISGESVRVALSTLCRRHDVLRARFVEHDDELLQLVDDDVEPWLEQIDLSALPDGPREAALLEVKHRLAVRRFDLDREPPLAVALIRLAADEHVLQFTVHHIAADGHSIVIMGREFAEALAALRDGRAPELPPLSHQYADFAEWQRELFDGAAADGELTFWREMLADAPAVHSLPLDRPRPDSAEHRGAALHQAIDGPDAAQIREACTQHSVTPFMFLQTTFALLVARLSGEQDVVVGFPVSGRNAAELEPLVGLFVNNLVLRTQIEGNPSFESLLQAGKQQIVEVLARPSLPFDRLVEAIAPRRGSSHHPLFQLVFGFNEVQPQPAGLAGLATSAEALQRDSAKVDLELSVADDGKRLQIGWIYDSELFDAATVRSFMDAFSMLLRGVAGDAERGVHDYPLVDPNAAAKLVELGRGRPNDLGGETLYARFAAEGLRVPDATAVDEGNRRISYRQLLDRSERLASYLTAATEPGERIGLCLMPSIEAVIGVLAALRCGRTYVPIDPTQPAARKQFVLDDAGIGLLLGSRDLIDDMPLGGRDFMLLDDALDDANWLPGHAVIAAGEVPEAPAYVLYTSGTSGQPKGVVVEQAGLLNYLVYAEAEYYRRQPVKGGVVSTPLCFDATLTTLLGPLLSGCTVRCLSAEALRNGELAALLAGEAGDWVFKLTPAHLEALLPDADVPLIGRASHRLVIGGEQLHAPLLLRWRSLLPNTAFVNEYGPTETVVGCAIRSIEAGARFDQMVGGVSIGRPINNTRLYVLGSGGQLQPRGSIGELFIGGDGVASGYLGREQTTAERFVADPFAGGSARMYRSGDRVHWRADGDLEYLGRSDRQVKLHGYRIELDEIEAQLRSIEFIDGAAALVSTRTDGSLALVGFVSTQRADGARSAELALRERLPAYMVPRPIIALPQLPLTANGKIDYRELMALAAAPAMDSRVVSQAPRTPIEQELAGIWKQLLGVAQVGVHDDFFALGGHSILATRLVSSVRRRLSVELPLRKLFEQPTIAGLARLIGELGDLPVLPAIVADPGRGPSPLSYAQQRLWFLDRLEGGSGHYNMPAALRLSGVLEVDALR